MDLKSVIRNLPDYPKPGVMFRDITTLLADEEGFSYAIDQLTDQIREYAPTKIVGIEARGFVVGAVVAYKLGLGFSCVRKPGKLPFETIGLDYDLEYGTDRVEIHVDAFNEKDRVVVIDDLIATGGTAVAACALVERAGAKVIAAGFIIDLPELGGSARLEKTGVPVRTLVQYDGL